MHETKICPCCNKPFECKSGSITLCQCMDVYISTGTNDLLAKQYDECLCKECLIMIEQANGGLGGRIGN